MNNCKKISAVTLSLSMMAIAFIGVFSFDTHEVNAQCGPGGSEGNLSGYATTSNGFGPIYMSDESWEAATGGTSGVDFGVSYDRTTGLWNGRGWNEYIGWVDFGGEDSSNTINKTATFEEIADNRAAWGNWDPIIYLDEENLPHGNIPGVTYASDPGGFEGYGFNGEYTTVGGDDSNDVLVGAGTVDFSNVVLFNVACTEFVDVTINNASRFYQETCNIDNPLIRWRTTNIIPGTCSVVDNTGLWSGTKSNNGQETGGDITDTNSPVTLELECTGSISGDPVIGRAIGVCGANSGIIIDPVTGRAIPEFREV